ncbi:MAG: L-threonylcarbamoyladenylate synthase [Gemmatimonadetes bacterium]|jgi:L-threonylcarbamoyladenylate synthase|nr:L-threonylcarbamoyladenylate synthase [Gemmatimonadota bacterium]MEE2846886.1 L-threonylcarbamoyladenylate synthase [Gemmatimonadota bacterium]|tara:strand:- start:1188 stop:1847 length:660 start_codon:yes stop_codon:yes gene_type:complete
MAELGRRTDLREDPEADLALVVAHLEGDGVIGYPTETVYGFGALGTSEGIRNVQELKGRKADRPLIALVPSAGSVQGLVWTDEARELASIFWPGSVTLVLRDPHRIFRPGVRSLDGTVAVRVSPQPIVERLLERLAVPLTSTSLNEPGRKPARSGAEATEVIERLGRSDIWLLDGGTLPQSGPSTIIDCTSGTPTVLREGTVPVGRLRCVIPEIHANHP